MDVDDLIGSILTRKKQNELLVIGISGIDGSGKSFLSEKIRDELIKKGYSVHLEKLDAWLNLPSIRFSDKNPAETFYKNGFRFDELKKKVLLPYIKNKKVSFEMDYLEETWDKYKKKKVNIEKVDIFILEGIFIFKEDIVRFLNYKIWIECPFDIALDRAIHRNQEGMNKDELIKEYNNRFFAAQSIHFEIDNPKEKADLVYMNS